MLLGFMPSQVGGFASSALFNFKKQQINDTVFYTDCDPQGKKRLYVVQHRLMQGLLALEHIDENKAHTHLAIQKLIQ